jgi:hypothetical protein
MLKYKYRIEESSSHISKTKLDFPEKIQRVPIELATILDDPQAKINMDEDNHLLTVESSLLTEREIHYSVEKCLLGLDLFCPEVIKSTL